MQASIKLYKIRVTGKVQGVFYRKSTAAKAQELNISGSVKNQADGSVFIVAQGSEKNLDTLLKWCESGPAHAEVDKVEYQEGVTQDLNDFRIIY